MKQYLEHTFDPNDPELVSVIDELPVWSAPFGFRLLEKVEMKQGLRFLDIGCGLGFPLVEIAQRLGNSSTGYGLDPWEPALERIRLKTRVYNIQNVKTINGTAENIPFENKYFDLIVSNNGLNNVQDLRKSLSECSRVAKPGAQLIITFNLDETMIEFYSVFEAVLNSFGLAEEVKKMKAHIYGKRRPVNEIKDLLDEAGFSVKEVVFDSFKFRFFDAESMFNHSFIKYWFLDSWKKLLQPEDVEKVFEQIEERLNKSIEPGDCLSLSVPFVTMDCARKHFE